MPAPNLFTNAVRFLISEIVAGGTYPSTDDVDDANMRPAAAVAVATNAAAAAAVPARDVFLSTMATLPLNADLIRGEERTRVRIMAAQMW